MKRLGITIGLDQSGRKSGRRLRGKVPTMSRSGRT